MNATSPALVVLMTTGGMPCIYYGDEAYVAFKEDRAGGDDAIRPALPRFPRVLHRLAGRSI
jgi:cyclomaltodextrinase / maltogenic alpha-amylase / neopullulanase